MDVQAWPAGPGAGAHDELGFYRRGTDEGDVAVLKMRAEAGGRGAVDAVALEHQPGDEVAEVVGVKVEELAGQAGRVDDQHVALRRQRNEAVQRGIIQEQVVHGADGIWDAQPAGELLEPGQVKLGEVQPVRVTLPPAAGVAPAINAAGRSLFDGSDPEAGGNVGPQSVDLLKPAELGVVVVGDL